MIAAYAIGHSLLIAITKGTLDHVKTCEHGQATGCLISWDAHESEHKPSAPQNSDKLVLWNSFDYFGLDASPRVCADPINQTSDNQWIEKSDHVGNMAIGSKIPEPDRRPVPIIPEIVAAPCGTNEGRNWLFVNGDRY